VHVFGVDGFSLLARQLLRERASALIAEACAWVVGMSDRPYFVYRDFRLVNSGTTLGERAAGGLPLGSEESGRLELGSAAPGSFSDALNAVTEDGTLYADRFDRDVVAPFVRETCVLAAERARERRPEAWAQLIEELGENPDDLDAVVRAGDWEDPVGMDADVLLMSALGNVPLVEAEAEGLPLSLVRAAEDEVRRAAPSVADEPAAVQEDELAGALFLARSAVDGAQLPLPVPPSRSGDLLDLLLSQDLSPTEILRVLPSLPVQQDTIESLTPTLERLTGDG
jgi:hypothetical protein